VISHGRDLVEGGVDVVGEVGVHGEGLGDFEEGPAAVGLEVVDAGDPVGVHGEGFLLRVLAAEALDLDDEVERIFLSVAVVDFQDEVREVAVGGGSLEVGDFA
jgi:hypothetical protein